MRTEPLQLEFELFADSVKLVFHERQHFGGFHLRPRRALSAYARGDYHTMISRSEVNSRLRTPTTVSTFNSLTVLRSIRRLQQDMRITRYRRLSANP